MTGICNSILLPGATTTVESISDSPLKPFSGRVVKLQGLSLRQLDHGFYYDDSDLPIVVAPVRTNIAPLEWRLVVVQNQVVAGSGYTASTRSEVPLDIEFVDKTNLAAAEVIQYASAIIRAAEAFGVG